jgi:hypothetical protein
MGNLCDSGSQKVRQCLEVFEIFPKNFSEAEKKLFASYFKLQVIPEKTYMYKVRLACLTAALKGTQWCIDR